MARGRKRKPGPRTASGQLSRSAAAVAYRDEGAVVRQQPHRRWLPEDKRADQRAETVLGRMRLGGMLTEAQYQAGVRWAAIVHRMHVALCVPRGPISIAGKMVPSGNEPPAEDDRPADFRTEEERHEAAMKDFNIVLGKLASDEVRALDVVVVRDRCPIGFDMQVLAEALNRLADLWKIADDEVRAA